MTLNFDNLEAMQSELDKQLMALQLDERFNTGISTGRMNHEVIRIITELPIILTQKARIEKTKKRQQKAGDNVVCSAELAMNVGEKSKENKYEHPNNIIAQAKETGKTRDAEVAADRCDDKADGIVPDSMRFIYLKAQFRA